MDVGVLAFLVAAVLTDEGVHFAVGVHAEFVGLAQAVLAEWLTYHTTNNYHYPSGVWQWL